jgi:hypothetical protein
VPIIGTRSKRLVPKKWHIAMDKLNLGILESPLFYFEIEKLELSSNCHRKNGGTL